MTTEEEEVDSTRQSLRSFFSVLKIREKTARCPYHKQLHVSMALLPSAQGLNDHIWPSASSIQGRVVVNTLCDNSRLLGRHLPMDPDRHQRVTSILSIDVLHSSRSVITCGSVDRPYADSNSARE